MRGLLAIATGLRAANSEKFVVFPSEAHVFHQQTEVSGLAVFTRRASLSARASGGNDAVPAAPVFGHPVSSDVINITHFRRGRLTEVAGLVAQFPHHGFHAGKR